MRKSIERVYSAAPSQDVAPHLFPIGNGWALWRSVCVRGAGFAAHGVLELAMSECAAAVDRLVQLEIACEAQRVEAVRLCEAGNQLGMSGAGSSLTRAMKQLRAGLIPEPFQANAEIVAASEAFARLHAAVAAQRLVVSEALAQETPRVGAALRRAASEKRLREAMLWQNRGAVKGTVDALLRKPSGATDSKTREHERLMASYMQRYCVKNDTIGFFGPVGWGTLVDHGRVLSLHPGPTLLAQRTLYFETWGIQLVAETLASDPALRPHLVPRRIPTVRLEGSVLFHSIDRSTELPAEYASIVAACDGERTAAEIAELVSADPTLGLSGRDEAYALLEDLVAKRVLTWTLELPTTLAHPERTLRSLVERAPPGQARTQALAAISELEQARDAIARSREDEEELDRSLAELDRTFERITGAAAQRRGGKAYAGRTLVFEDCTRDIALELGPAFAERLAPPLLLLLQAARWYTFEIARRYTAALNTIYAELRAELGTRSIDFVRFLAVAEKLFSGSQYAPSPMVAEVIDELRARWATVLRIPAGIHRVERTVAELRPRIDSAFAAPHPGWPGARYHSPDIMIAASSVEAVRRGQYLLVLGELHTGDNTAANPVFIHQHPEPLELVRAIEHDLPEPRICLVVPKERSTRADQLSPCRHDFDVEFGSTRSWRPRSSVLAVGDLLVEEVDGALYVRTRDGKQQFHVLAFFEHYLKLESIAHFTPLPVAPHTPRVTIDGLVIARERWRFEPAEVAFANAPDLAERFIGARRFAQQNSLPRFVFVKVPEEIKPCFVDFESPVFVEIFAKLVRKASVVTLSEMLPSVDENWLIDADAQAYTSELRFVAVDPECWRAT